MFRGGKGLNDEVDWGLIEIIFMYNYLIGVHWPNGQHVEI